MNVHIYTVDKCSQSQRNLQNLSQMLSSITEPVKQLRVSMQTNINCEKPTQQKRKTIETHLKHETGRDPKRIKNKNYAYWKKRRRKQTNRWRRLAHTRRYGGQMLAARDNARGSLSRHSFRRWKIGGL